MKKVKTSIKPINRKVRYRGLILLFICCILIVLVFPLNLKIQIKEHFELKYEINAPTLNLAESKAWTDEGIAICTDINSQYDPLYFDGPKIVSDGFGGAMIAWYDNRSGNYDIYAQKINFRGEVQLTIGGVPISTAPNDQLYLRMISDEFGGAIIVWEDERDGTKDIYAQKINDKGIVNWTVNGIVITNAIGDQTNSQLVSDGLGGAIITWEDERGGSKDIFAQRIDFEGQTLWNTNGTVICNATGYQDMPKLANDGYNGAVITWEDNRNSNEDIYIQHVNSLGQTSWLKNGTALCNLTSNQYIPQPVRVGYDNFIVAWGDYRNDNYDIYAQRIDINGETQWIPNGSAICNELERQWDIDAVEIDSEGIVITWRDERNGIDFDIYAQKINLEGQHLWTTNGTVVCNKIGDQRRPQITTDGSGKIIITWQDNRGGNTDIYAQILNNAGEPQWNANGTIICNSTGNQDWPQLVGDGARGAIITWADLRNGNGDIYAQRMKPNNAPSLIPLTNMTTKITGTETIGWTLSDDTGVGEYRVLVNDSSGNAYIWIDWSPWINDTTLNVLINRSFTGTFTYTIEYHDNYHVYGTPDTIYIKIFQASNESHIDILIVLLILVIFASLFFFGALFVVKKRKAQSIIETPGSIITRLDRTHLKATNSLKNKVILKNSDITLDIEKKLADSIPSASNKALETIESEMQIEKPQFTCVVHRGLIQGSMYACPHCQTVYCQKCLRSLKSKGEKCWTCKNEFDIDSMD